MARRSSCGDRTRLVVRWRRAWSGSGCRGGQAGMMDPAGWAALLGFGRRLPLDAVSALLIPWCIVGLLLLLGSGVLLFAADATPLFSNTLLRVKLLLIGLGTGNAWVFHRVWATRLADWDRRPPAAGRVQVTLSIMCWLLAAGLGRLIAYG